MVRIGKQEERRHRNPKKRHHKHTEKTGTKKDNLPQGHRLHTNALEGNLTTSLFIPKIR